MFIYINLLLPICNAFVSNDSIDSPLHHHRLEAVSKTEEFKMRTLYSNLQDPKFPSLINEEWSLLLTIVLFHVGNESGGCVPYMKSQLQESVLYKVHKLDQKIRKYSQV